MRSDLSKNEEQQFTPTIYSILDLLLAAFQTARDDGGIRDKALSLVQMEQAGVRHDALRQFMREGYVQHVIATGAGGRKERRWQSANGRAFTPRSHFVLTADGIALARRVCLSEVPNDIKPCWDPVQRKLWVDGRLVKHFKQPADNQELIIQAFEEEGWPSTIDDPLPPKSGINPKRHLHDTVGNLNRRQITPLLHFRCNGHGTAILWELRK